VGRPGAFAEFLTLPEANLHVVPNSISNEAAVFAEPLAAACEILDQAAIPDSAEVAVLGDGKLGLLVAQALNANRKNVHLYGRHRSKLRIAERGGIQAALVQTKSPLRAYDWVVEATGSARGLLDAIRMTRPRGTVILKSTVHNEMSIDTARVVVNEITLVGSRCGRFEPALALLQSRRINVADMISESMPLAQARRAFARAAAPGVLKVLLLGD
jgi:alcohol dehydrogenase